MIIRNLKNPPSVLPWRTNALALLLAGQMHESKTHFTCMLPLPGRGEDGIRRLEHIEVGADGINAYVISARGNCGDTAIRGMMEEGSTKWI